MIQVHDGHVAELEELLQDMLLKCKGLPDMTNRIRWSLMHIDQAKRGYTIAAPKPEQPAE